MEDLVPINSSRVYFCGLLGAAFSELFNRVHQKMDTSFRTQEAIDEELEVLRAIFFNDITNDDTVPNQFHILIEPICSMTFWFESVDSGVFSSSQLWAYPPCFQIDPLSGWRWPLKKSAKKQQQIRSLLIAHCQHQLQHQVDGASVIYDWVQLIRENAEQYFEQTGSHAIVATNTTTMQRQLLEDDGACECGGIVIVRGDPITIKKSKFEARVARVVSLNQVHNALKRISHYHCKDATHNMMAFRLMIPNKGLDGKEDDLEDSTLDEGFEDDGEHGAGRRLLHLLQAMKLTNVVVVVSRWYGGIQLGPDRFRRTLSYVCSSKHVKFDFLITNTFRDLQLRERDIKTRWIRQRS